jgi:predicted RNA binding protein YcfA (HicA-like mRNA interferase family)
MKLSNFIRHLNKYKCYLHREGGNHSIFQHAATKKISSVPRHKEINPKKSLDFFALCADD